MLLHQADQAISLNQIFAKFLFRRYGKQGRENTCHAERQNTCHVERQHEQLSQELGGWPDAATTRSARYFPARAGNLTMRSPSLRLSSAVSASTCFPQKSSASRFSVASVARL